MKHHIHHNILPIKQKLPRLGQGANLYSGYENDVNAFKTNFAALETALITSAKGTTLFQNAMNQVYTAVNKSSVQLGTYLSIMDTFKAKNDSLVQALTVVESRNASLATGFHLSAEDAAAAASKLREFGLLVGISDVEMMKAAVSLKEITNGFILSSKANTYYNQKLLEGQVYLTRNLQLTDETAKGMAAFAKAKGRTVADLIAAYEESNFFEKIAEQMGVDKAQLMAESFTEIAKLSKSTQNFYNKIPGNLEKAVIQARALGVTMNDVQKVGKASLDIEKSIAAEIEFQQLSGERLLTTQGKSWTEEMRMATLRRDGPRQAELLNELYSQYGDKILDNMLLLENVSTITGLTEDQITEGINKSSELARGVTKTEPGGVTGEGTVFSKAVKDVKLNQPVNTPALRDVTEKIRDFAPDIRSTQQQVETQFQLKQAKEIQGKGIKATDVGKIQQGAVNYMGANSGFMAPVSQFKAISTDAGNAKLGDIVNDATTKTVSTVSKTLKPNDNTTFGTAVETFDSAVNKFSAGISIWPVPKAPAGGGVTEVNDTLISANGNIIRPDENDVIAAFKTGGVISNTMNQTMNQTMMPSNDAIASEPRVIETQPIAKTESDTKTLITQLTNTINNNTTKTEALDVNKLAAAIADAMKSVTIQTTAIVKTNDMYNGNVMNTPPRFTV